MQDHDRISESEGLINRMAERGVRIPTRFVDLSALEPTLANAMTPLHPAIVESFFLVTGELFEQIIKSNIFSRDGRVMVQEYGLHRNRLTEPDTYEIMDFEALIRQIAIILHVFANYTAKIDGLPLNDFLEKILNDYSHWLDIAASYEVPRIERMRSIRQELKEFKQRTLEKEPKTHHIPGFDWMGMMIALFKRHVPTATDAAITVCIHRLLVFFELDKVKISAIRQRIRRGKKNS